MAYVAHYAFEYREARGGSSRRHWTLLDLVSAIADEAETDEEVVATVQH